jgi:hypothetical protein
MEVALILGLSILGGMALVGVLALVDQWKSR